MGHEVVCIKFSRKQQYGGQSSWRVERRALKQSAHGPVNTVQYLATVAARLPHLSDREVLLDALTLRNLRTVCHNVRPDDDSVILDLRFLGVDFRRFFVQNVHLFETGMQFFYPVTFDENHIPMSYDSSGWMHYSLGTTEAEAKNADFVRFSSTGLISADDMYAKSGIQIPSFRLTRSVWIISSFICTNTLTLYYNNK